MHILSTLELFTNDSLQGRTNNDFLKTELQSMSKTTKQSKIEDLTNPPIITTNVPVRDVSEASPWMTATATSSPSGLLITSRDELAWELAPGRPSADWVLGTRLWTFLWIWEGKVVSELVLTELIMFTWVGWVAELFISHGAPEARFRKPLRCDCYPNSVALLLSSAFLATLKEMFSRPVL